MAKVLIIGATSAIAQAIARRLASPANAMMLWARSQSKVDLVAQDLRVRCGADIATEVFDFNDLDFHSGVMEKLLKNFGDVDLVVICYGTLGDQPACQENFGETLKQMTTNCLGVLSFLTHFANYFERRKTGCIVVVASVAGDRGRQSNYVYGTAKAALDTFLQGLRNRLYRSGVQVITVKPGFVVTPMTAHTHRNFLFANPDRVAKDVARAIERRQPVVYTPWFWRYIMLVIRLIPEHLFQRLKL